MIPQKAIEIIIQDVAVALMAGSPISIPLLILKIGKDVLENVDEKELENFIVSTISGMSNFVFNLDNLIKNRFGSSLTDKEVKEFFENLQLNGS